MRARSTKGARRQQARPLHWRPQRAGLRAWARSHAHGMLSSLGRLWRRPIATALTVGVIAVALSLPLALVTLLGNVQQLAPAWQGAEEIPVFLQAGADLAQAQELAEQISAQHAHVSVRIQPPDQSLAEFRQLSGFSDALEVLDYNPLPYVLLLGVERGVGDQLAELVAAVHALDAVDFVQFDARWRERLDAWLAALQQLSRVLAVVLGLAVVLVVGNTVRLDVQTRGEEILITKLLGATDGFVRRPFLYLGLWYGVMGGTLAVLVVAIATRVLNPAIRSLAETYGSEFSLQGAESHLVLGTLATGLVLGWLGAHVVTSRHLAALSGR